MDGDNPQGTEHSEVARRNPPAVDERFIEGMNSQRGISGFSEKMEWYKMFGGAIGGWNIFRSGCFQAWDCNNQSLNLSPSGRRLVPR